MADLTPDEFDRMQREARARVIEMKKRSRFITEELNAEALKKNKLTEKVDYKNEERCKTEKVNIKKHNEAEYQNDTEKRREEDDVFESLFLLLLSELLKESNKDIADFLLMILLL